MNDLEQYRKRAKHLVRQHRSRSYAVTERLRRSLPRLAGMSDRQVLDAPFALHDAQQVIAAELGFGSWAELKEQPPMPSSTTVPPQRFDRALAQVFVRDVTASVAFYRDLLGFEVAYVHGQPPYYAEIGRDNVAFNLRQTDRSPWDLDPDEPDLLAVAVYVTDAKSIFLEYDAKGVRMHRRLREEYGHRGFIVCDPDDNLVQFLSRL
jgi:catechol 2,3-dioxygenase-like lactoylglutathione lyase family enzyme